MKTIAVITAILVFSITATASTTTPVEGKRFELSTAFSLGSSKGKGESGSIYWFNLPLRLGYFIWKGLEFEPEFKFTVTGYTGSYGESEAGYILSGNLLYNFPVKESGRFLPFLLAGWGFGNAYPYPFGAVGKIEGANVSVMNLGSGIRYLFGKVAAFRFEYRFVRVSAKFAYDAEVAFQHNIFLGICLFF